MLLIVDDSKVSRMLIRAHILAQRLEWAIYYEAVCGEETKAPFIRKTTTTC
jgi:two-component system chemotaxis response regulator CheY